MVDAEDAEDAVEVADEVSRTGSVRARMSRVSPSFRVEPGGEYGGGALILVCCNESDSLMDIAVLYWKQYIYSAHLNSYYYFHTRYRSRSTYSSLSQC